MSSTVCLGEVLWDNIQVLEIAEKLIRSSNAFVLGVW